MNGFYSIYPKYNPNIKQISIKLFLNMRNPAIFKVLPVNFCCVRRCYVFDIKKTKFPLTKKLFRFNFIINNEIVLVPSYKNILFGNNYVNEVNFSDYEKNIYNIRRKMSKPNFIKFRNRKEEIEESDSDSDSDFACINLKRPSKMNINMYKSMESSSFKKYKNHSKKKKSVDIAQSERSITMKSTFVSDNDTQENNNSPRPKLKRVRSILKMSKRNSNFLSKSSDCLMKKVSFGFVKYSY